MKNKLTQLAFVTTFLCASASAMAVGLDAKVGVDAAVPGVSVQNKTEADVKAEGQTDVRKTQPATSGQKVKEKTDSSTEGLGSTHSNVKTHTNVDGKVDTKAKAKAEADAKLKQETK